MEKLRRCKGKANVYVNGKWETLEFPLGYFHNFSMAYEEFENGPGNYAIAIVELPDGRVVLPAADDIVFLDRIEETQDPQETQNTQKNFECQKAEEVGEDVIRCPYYFAGACSADNIEEDCLFND